MIWGDKVDGAFDSFLSPLLGLLFRPWTTLFYVIARTPIDGVTGVNWLFVGHGLAFDLMTYSQRAAKGKTQYYKPRPPGILVSEFVWSGKSLGHRWENPSN